MTDESRPFLDHLEELRRRLGIVFLAVAVFFFVGYYYVDPIIHYLSRPAGTFIFVKPTEAFLIRLKISLIVGVLLSIPVVIYQIWRFVAVALTPSEKKTVLWMMPFSYILFCAGSAIAWFIVLPTAVRFLLGFSTQDLRPMLSIGAYVEFAAWFTAAFGLAFQLPIVVFFLVKIGVATPKSLCRYRRHVILGLAIIAAVLTPGPDLFSQLALLVPTYLLYEMSILMARFTSRKGGVNRRAEIAP